MHFSESEILTFLTVQKSGPALDHAGERIWARLCFFLLKVVF